MPNIGLNAVAGRAPEEYGIDPTSFDEMRAGCYDVHGREADVDLGLTMLRLYNDWHIDEWCGAYAGRFIPLAVPPMWDPHLMADEGRRLAAKGCHAVTFSENPEKLGMPSYHEDH